MFSLFQKIPTSHSSKLCILSFQNKTTINKTTNMKTLLFTISLTFSLLASAQVTQTAPNCADDKEGTKAGKLFDSEGTPWNLSGIKDMYHLNGAPYTGIVKVCNANTGKVLSKKSYVDGILDGLSYKYHQDGWLKWQKNYASGELDGEVIHYFSDGSKRSKENYSAGKQDGTQKFFYSNGVLKEVYFCNSDGKKHGLHKYYYKKDSKKFIETYSNGVLDGKQEYFDRNEQLIEEAQWSAGVHQSGLIHVYGFFVWHEDLGAMRWDDAVAACEALGDGWHLPTKDELNLLYQNKEKFVGLITNSLYWSSTEYGTSSSYAWRQRFIYGSQDYFSKNGFNHVRAVRDFNP